MKYPLCAGLFALMLINAPAYADPNSGVVIQQMDQKSVLLPQAKDDIAATDATKPAKRSIGEDVKDILTDYRSEIGRANGAVSSQYGSQPIIVAPEENKEVLPIKPQKH